MNKKKIFGLTTAALMVAVIAVNMSISSIKRGLSDVSLANVEALAENEGDDRYQSMGYCGFWFWTMDYMCVSRQTAESCRRDCS